MKTMYQTLKEKNMSSNQFQNMDLMWILFQTIEITESRYYKKLVNDDLYLMTSLYYYFRCDNYDHFKLFSYLWMDTEIFTEEIICQ